jgi:hypothetical protein
MPRPSLFSLLVSLACATSGDDPADLPVLPATPEWRLPANAADLTRVTAMAVSPDGEIALAQPLDDHAKIVATDRTVRMVGRDGAGPGEFRYPSRVGYVGDHLYVVDPQIYRVSLFDQRDSLLGMFNEPRTVWVDGSEVAGIEMNLQAVLPGGKLRMRAVVGRGAPNPPWAVSPDSGLSWLIQIDTSGAFEHLIAEEPVYRCHMRMPAGERLVLMTIPFCAEPLHTGYDGGDVVALVDQPQGGEPRYRVRLIDRDGAALFDVTRGYAPIAVPQAALDSQRAESAARRERSTGPLPDDPPPAATLPPVQQILVGRDSTVWLELEDQMPRHTWLILDRRGRAVGTVVIPASHQLRAAELGRLWALEENADGLQGVVVMRVL